MDNPEYCEINSNMTLEYINKILMEEDIDETASIYQEPDALQATEKPFYDILGQTYPSSAKETVMNGDSQVDCPMIVPTIIVKGHAVVASSIIF